VYPFDEASAFQKEIRRGDVRAAMYWGHLLYGEAPY
jgi:replication-associated recombination protein RarA